MQYEEITNLNEVIQEGDQYAMVGSPVWSNKPININDNIYHWATISGWTGQSFNTFPAQILGNGRFRRPKNSKHHHHPRTNVFK